MNLDNFEQAESSYNRDYDPCADVCPYCESEDIDFILGDSEYDWHCLNCGEKGRDE